MPRHPNQNSTKERNHSMKQDNRIMLKLAELLYENQLISPDEKSRLVQLIRKDGEV